jgi:hypothetical protein
MTIVLVAAAVAFVAVNAAFLLGACRVAAEADRNLRAVFALTPGGEVRTLPRRQIGADAIDRAAG